MTNTLLIILILYVPLLVIMAIVFSFIYRHRDKLLTAKPHSYKEKVEQLPSKERMLLDTEGCDDYEEIKMRLFNLFEKEKTYLDPNIRIADIAEKLFTNKTYLSRAIKARTNKNFCQLVHYYRVRDAIKMFTEDPELSITELSKMVGFNSMTTFNTAFGRNTGFTPAEWCKDFKKKSVTEENYVGKRHSN